MTGRRWRLLGPDPFDPGRAPPVPWPGRVVDGCCAVPALCSPSCPAASPGLPRSRPRLAT